jgi:hypothetical protein
LRGVYIVMNRSFLAMFPVEVVAEFVDQ